MTNYNEIELSIRETLNLYAIEARDRKFSSDRDWTQTLKERLGRLGEEKYNYKVCASGFKDDFEPEWLFDLIWYKEEGETNQRRLIDVPLVVESEWNKHFDHIKYDFEKLLVANAQHRLFVCYVHIDNRTALFEYFKDAVNQYKLNRTGDRYMIAVLDYDTHEFVYELIVKN